ncbi:Wzz/FepE/Etk N-terminal domain-containing protein [Georgenia yuyongxinii]|uniref:Uncharacterized protein n=1 Tax=Georgenia yuyongxinii TaxID=2589797 RepID=A0A552WM56_9MICO|nr:Wzz/FepE/Etk N-terminal domain-containing protein [Georgenia yuyongxinii]TRW43573.1 hypothetical protein FJ693_17115 [Georgenia yuyongxinii]
MYLRDLAKGLIRRWYYVVVGVLLVAGLGVLTLTVVPPTFEARANVLLVPPQTSVTNGDNPFLMLGGLTQPLDVVAKTLDADITRQALLDDAPGADYVVEPDSTSNSPILVVEATGATSAQALEVLHDVLDAVPTTLQELQGELEVAPPSQVTSMTLTVDERATAVQKERLRVVLAVSAVGLAGVVLLIGLLDGILIARRRLRTATRDLATTGEVTSPEQLAAPATRRDQHTTHAAGATLP